MRITELGDGVAHSRLALADEFFQAATGLTEIAIRNSLSRLYYANYHLAVGLTGEKNHGNLARKLIADFPSIGNDFKNLRDLRNQMDYTPEFFSGKGRGDLQGWFTDRMEEGVALYYRLKALMEAHGAKQR